MVTSAPETVAFIPALVCRDRAQLGQADLAQLPGERWTRSEFESVEFNRRYQLFTLAGQDTQFMYELFSPALVSWLCTEVPAGFGFELNGGNLSITQPGHLEDPRELDRMCSLAASLAQRIRAEAMEEGPGGAQLFREERARGDLTAAIREVDWEAAPPSVGAAVDAYRQAAADKPVGLEAFVREYARSRGLELQDRWAFHSEMRGLPMPGVADHVLAGTIPGADLNGRFVMFGNAPEMRSEGREVAWTADRPLAATGHLARLPEERRAELSAVPNLPEDYHLESRGRDVLVWRPIAGNLLRTGEGSDAFCAKAGQVVRGLAPDDVRRPAS